MLFEHFGQPDAAARIQAAVEADVQDRGEGARTTSEAGDAILARLK
jgi:3-isopropylmalate dehydrogenase